MRLRPGDIADLSIENEAGEVLDVNTKGFAFNKNAHYLNDFNNNDTGRYPKRKTLFLRS